MSMKLVEKRMEERKQRWIKEMKRNEFEYDQNQSLTENKMWYIGHLEKIGKEKEAKELYDSMMKAFDLMEKFNKKYWKESKLRRLWMKTKGEKLFRKWLDNRCRKVPQRQRG